MADTTLSLKNAFKFEPKYDVFAISYIIASSINHETGIAAIVHYR